VVGEERASYKNSEGGRGVKELVSRQRRGSLDDLRRVARGGDESFGLSLFKKKRDALLEFDRRGGWGEHKKSKRILLLEIKRGGISLQKNRERQGGVEEGTSFWWTAGEKEKDPPF